MSKVIKEFWVSDYFIKEMNKPATELPGLTRISFECPIEKINTGDRHSAHKITISYEIDREVTIKESELDNILKSIGLVDVVQDCLKNRIFGGSENE